MYFRLKILNPTPESGISVYSLQINAVAADGQL